MAEMIAEDQAVATFAGGCFWCVQQAFDEVEGVEHTVVGYSGGDEVKPNYKQVSSGVTGHIESLQVIYNPAQVSYDELLVVFWKNIDPTVKDRQFCDVGHQYSAAIFAHNESQRQSATKSLSFVYKLFSKVYTEIYQYKSFYPAEDYHQKFYQKNPLRYRYYKYSCGRKDRLESLWNENNVEKLSNYLLDKGDLINKSLIEQN
jgi:peptide-methionine (S)-S-oxide reductase